MVRQVLDFLVFSSAQNKRQQTSMKFDFDTKFYETGVSAYLANFPRVQYLLYSWSFIKNFNLF